MIDAGYNPSHILRLYTWELLKANLGWTVINGVIPVIPVEDEPRVSDSGKAYIIYGYSENFDGEPREIGRGNFSMRVVAPSFTELSKIVNILQRAFESGDDSAENVNLWSTDFTATDLVGIRFTTLDTTYIEGGTPSELEGGPTEGVVNVAYRYVTHQKVKTYIGNGQWA